MLDIVAYTENHLFAHHPENIVQIYGFVLMVYCLILSCLEGGYMSASDVFPISLMPVSSQKNITDRGALTTGANFGANIHLVQKETHFCV